MPAENLPPLRLFRETPEADPHVLACRELLRPADDLPTRRGLEPFSRAWFEELEIKRYARQGMWLPRVLEFTRHAGDTLLMLRPGLGSDALQYLRHGVKVTMAVDEFDRADLITQNLEHRGQVPRFLPRPGPELPCENASFDLVTVNGMWGQPEDWLQLAKEAFRVLKPGGKLLALVPARYDVHFWASILIPWRSTAQKRLCEGPGLSGRALKQTFTGFKELKLNKRHLRRADLPTAWRLIPTSALDRLLGQVLCLRAFKPVRAAMGRITKVA